MRTLLWIGALFGGLVGGYVPVLFGVPYFSMTSVIGNALGGFAGLFLCYKLARHYDL